MARNVYVTAMEPGSGKSAIVLGLTEVLSRHAERLALYRPFVVSADVADPLQPVYDHLGLADGMVSGAAHTTAHTIRPAFEFIRTAPGVSLVSSAFLMCLADRGLVAITAIQAQVAT